MCKDLKLLVHGDNSLITADEWKDGKDVKVKWMRHGEYEDVYGKSKHDFQEKKTTISEVYEHMKEKIRWAGKPTWWMWFKSHHDLMEWCNFDKEVARTLFPRHHVHIICDFSENGELGRMKDKHASRYYDSHPFTLFGMVVAMWIEDALFLTAAERDRLIAIKDANGEPHLIIITHAVLSEDCNHDAAAR